jgi:polyhydroxyalkanoate synthesis regulator phasin
MPMTHDMTRPPVNHFWQEICQSASFSANLPRGDFWHENFFRGGLNAFNVLFGPLWALAFAFGTAWPMVCMPNLHGSCSAIADLIQISLTPFIYLKMEDLFKKFVYTGVGLVSMTVDKFQKSVEKLVDEDKLSQEEGKKLVDDLFKNTEAKREEFETKLKSVVEEVMVRMNLATQKQVQELQDRLAVIETQLGIEVPKKDEEAKSKKKAPSKKAETVEA